MINNGGGGVTQAAADARYVKLDGTNTMSGSLSQTTMGVAQSNGDSMSYTASAGPAWLDGNTSKIFTINVQSLTASRTVTVPNSSGGLIVASSTATTIGAAGAATALPAQPLGYMTLLTPGGVSVKVPYYNP